MRAALRLPGHKDCQYAPVVIQRDERKVRGWIDTTDRRYQWGTSIRPDGSYGPLEQFTYKGCLSLGTEEWEAIADVDTLNFVDNAPRQVLRTDHRSAATFGRIEYTIKGRRFLIPLEVFDVHDWTGQVVKSRVRYENASLFDGGG